MLDFLLLSLPCLPAKALSYELLKNLTSDRQPFLALYYLIETSLEGHQCVTVKGNHILPSPSLIEENPISSHDLIEGFSKMPRELIQEDNLQDLRPIVLIDDHFYLQKYFAAETKLAEEFCAFATTIPERRFSEEDIERVMSKKNRVNENQKQAIQMCLTNPVTLMTGGPGTGKSFTAKELIVLFCELCKGSSYQPKILVTAPTGKAAANLKQKIKEDRSLEDVNIDTKTLHSALAINARHRQEVSALYGYDLVVVDECSMVDVFVWKTFFCSLRKGARVLLMGDPFQLPPVESGMMFRDLVQGFGSVELKTCIRVQSLALLDLARAIRESDAQRIKQLLSGNDKEICFAELKDEDFFNIEEGTFAALQQDSLETKVVLTPLNKGPYGSKQLCEKIFLREKEKGEKIPILVTKTCYDLEIFNGDVGFLYQGKVHFGLDNEERQIPLSLIPQHEYAYALSIHKSQGSEYDEVVLLLPSGSERFGKELFYTAVTRAKKRLKIFAAKGVIERLFLVDESKHSCLSSRISSMLKGKANLLA